MLENHCLPAPFISALIPGWQPGSSAPETGPGAQSGASSRVGGCWRPVCTARRLCSLEPAENRKRGPQYSEARRRTVSLI